MELLLELLPRHFLYTAVYFRMLGAASRPVHCRAGESGPDIEHQTSEASTPHTTPNPVLVVSGLSKRVGRKLLFESLSFTVRKGETLFITGPSGVGKTQLLRSIAGLDPIESEAGATGRISLDGITQDDYPSLPAWRVQIAYIPQSQKGFTDTPAEFYFKVQRFRAQRNRPRGDLPALIHYLGLEQSTLHQPFHSLSGGQAQRVHLAIAVALGPAFLLLDEPTSALDTESARKVERLLKQSGCGLIWVSHDRTQLARVGGRVLDLSTGVFSCVANTPPLSPEQFVRSSLPKSREVTNRAYIFNNTEGGASDEDDTSPVGDEYHGASGVSVVRQLDA
jgi:ABC-type iron transport system FetAB ATPase subunit